MTWNPRSGHSEQEQHPNRERRTPQPNPPPPKKLAAIIELRVVTMCCVASRLRERAVFERLAPRTGKQRAIIAVTRRLVVRLRARWLDGMEDARAAAA
jgi:hypothetical protein